MRTVPLQQLCEIQIGKTPSRSVPEYWGGELPWVTISDFAAGRTVETTKERITEVGAEKSGSKLIPHGTLLLSFKLSLGKRAYAGCDLFTNEAIAALQVLDQAVADRDYLYWALGSINYDSLVDRAAKGKTLNKAKLKILQVPLPPLAEQKRIAGILDAADALRAKRRESLAQLDTLLQSTFLEMFGDPVTNPMGWEVHALQELIQSDRPITYGILKPGPDIDDGVPYVRVVDIKNEQVLIGQLRRTTPEIASQYKRSRLETGDLLMSIRGHVGRMAIVPAPGAGANITQDTARLALSSADPSYVMQCLSTQGMQQYMARRTKGVAVKGINLGDVKRIPIPAPPLDLQHRFAAIVESVEQQKASQRAHLEELDTLFASLQSRAFQGEL